MPKGGARTRSGPAADPASLRQTGKADDWTKLPGSGRLTPPPDWPLTEASGRESAMWERLWALPQAVEWDRRRQDLEVALYVRRLVEVESPGSSVNLGTLVRQMSDSLGLTTPGMRANRWLIVDDAPAETAPARRSSSRARLRAVPSDAGA